MKNKVYCCFQFFNENELLKLKLEELWNVVDYFVIVEGQTTHTGIPKPLNFLKDGHLFEPYKEKIIYFPVSNNRPDNTDPKFTLTNQRHDAIVAEIKRIAPWDYCTPNYSRDIYEKESTIVPLLERCSPEDVVILGDCDEISKASVLADLLEHFDPDQIYHLHHLNYWYYLNLEKTNERWYGNIVLSFKKYLENSFCNMRQHKQGIFVPDAGWHFSYMPVSRIKYKTEALTHQDLCARVTSEIISEKVKNAMLINQDLYGRPAKFEKREIGLETYPRYLVEHLEDYTEFILHD